MSRRAIARLLWLLVLFGIGVFFLFKETDLGLSDSKSSSSGDSPALASGSPAVSVKVRYTGTFQADYTNGGYSYHFNFTWDESLPVTVQYSNDQVVSSTPGTGTLTASGTARSTGTLGGVNGSPNDSCGYNAAPSPTLKITINPGPPSATGGSSTLNVQARMPQDTDANGRFDGQLTTFGTCSTTAIGGVNPYLHQNPLGGTFDPGGKLQAMEAGAADRIDVNQLSGQPFSTQFPVDYTQTDNTGGSEHVVANATLTVSVG